MARMTQASVNAYIKRAQNGGWLKKKPEIRKVVVAKKLSPNLEGEFEFQLKLAGVTGYTREYRFCDRRWRFDFCVADPDIKVALEIEGGIHCRGRHVRPEGFRNDARKYRQAAIDGWLVLRVTAADIRNGDALRDFEKAIEVRRKGVVSVRA